MKIILLAILGALILLWGAILVIFKWAIPIQKKHFIGLGVYASVLCATVIFLVLQTSLTQQEAALRDTQGRFYQELSAFRERLGEQTDRLMTQINEKAELTGSEVEIRGQLREEKNQHRSTRNLLRETRSKLNREAAARAANMDSLKVERALHQATRNRLNREETLHGRTRSDLRKVRRDLSKTQERAANQKKERDRLQTALKRAQNNAGKALASAETAGKRLLKKADNQQSNLQVLQASVDSIYQKVLKRPRVLPRTSPRR